jgi:hypothetical protein
MVAGHGMCEELQPMDGLESRLFLEFMARFDRSEEWLTAA